MAINNLPPTSWDFMPPEQHFSDPKSLKDAIFFYQQTRLQAWEKQDPRFLPTPGKFELIENKTRKFCLWPTALDYVFLFRGQQSFHEKCTPTLYRGNKKPEEIFLERIKLIEFERLISQYPSVRYFEANNIEVDYLGLAQHYLIDTEILDLTTDLDVAMFFAMCDFDGHEYNPKQEEKEYIAYIYAYPFAQEFDYKTGELTHRVKPIGLQPFKRPGEQKGFSRKMRKEQSFQATIYSFSFTKHDSEHIFNWFKANRPLFFEDEFSKRVNLIRASKVFSIDALKLAAKRFSAECFGKKKSAAYCQSQMIQCGYSFTAQQLPWSMTEDDIHTLQDAFNKEGRAELNNQIVMRKTFDEENGWRQCRTEKAFAEMLFLRMFMGGCPALPGYDSGFEISYTKTNEVSSLCFEYGRPQTVPNLVTGKIDKWDHLDWSKYSKLSINEDGVVEVPKNPD